MIQAQNIRSVVFQGPLSVATNATSATTVDTLGYDYAMVDVIHGPATATNSSAKWTALQLEHGTTTDASNHTTIDGGVGTTNSTTAATQFVLPVHNDTSVGGMVRFFVDCSQYERYLRVELQATDSHDTVCQIAHLFRAKDVPDSTTDRGINAQVFLPKPA